MTRINLEDYINKIISAHAEISQDVHVLVNRLKKMVPINKISISYIEDREGLDASVSFNCETADGAQYILSIDQAVDCPIVSITPLTSDCHVCFANRLNSTLCSDVLDFFVKHHDLFIGGEIITDIKGNDTFLITKTFDDNMQLKLINIYCGRYFSDSIHINHDNTQLISKGDAKGKPLCDIIIEEPKKMKM